MLDVVGYLIAGTASWFFGAVPPEPPSFAALWYREVLLGEVAAAADGYEALYLAAPSRSVSAESRERAAFRAGLCYARLGRLDSAALAYHWLGTNAPSSSPLRQEAALRLRSLRVADAGADPLLGASVELGIRKLAETLQAACRGRDEVMEALRARIAGRRDESAARERLLARLAREGVLLVFPSDLSPPDNPALPAALGDALRSAIPRETDLQRIQSTLAERYLERAALAMLARDPAAALPDLDRAASLAPSPVGSLGADCLSVARDGALRAEDAATIVHRRVVREDLVRSAALRREIRDLLESAETMVADRGRIDLAIGHLDRIRETLDWTRPALREDDTIRKLATRAERLLISLSRESGQDEALRKLWLETRERTDTVLSLAMDLADLVGSDARFRGPASLAGRRDGPAACRAELDRLLWRGQDSRRRGDAPGVEEALRDSSLLLAWVPGLDPLSSYRGAMEALRGGETRR